MSTPSGESAELQWGASGEALLALVETEVDETGVSYYGSTRLCLLSADPEGDASLAEETNNDLNKAPGGQYLPIQAVQWSPTEELFVLIRGFQPSQVSLWKYDRLQQKARMLSVLAEKAHRNTVKWNKFGTKLPFNFFFKYYSIVRNPDGRIF